MSNLKRNKGITLIALVITIIVLLILAAVTIGQLQNSGLFSKTQVAKETYTFEAAQEQLELKLAELQMERYANGKSQPTLNDLKTYLEDPKFEGEYEVELSYEPLAAETTQTVPIYAKVTHVPTKFVFYVDGKMVVIGGKSSEVDLMTENKSALEILNSKLNVSGYTIEEIINSESLMQKVSESSTAIDCAVQNINEILKPMTENEIALRKLVSSEYFLSKMENSSEVLKIVQDSQYCKQVFSNVITPVSSNTGGTCKVETSSEYVEGYLAFDGNIPETGYYTSWSPGVNSNPNQTYITYYTPTAIKPIKMIIHHGCPVGSGAWHAKFQGKTLEEGSTWEDISDIFEIRYNETGFGKTPLILDVDAIKFSEYNYIKLVFIDGIETEYAHCNTYGFYCYEIEVIGED